MKAPIDSGMPAVIRLAWPTILSFVLNNGFRINDQYWVKDMGAAAHAAIGSSTVLVILNFAVIYLAIGGSVPLVARATGAQDKGERDDVIRHTLFLGSLIALVLGIGGWFITPAVTGMFHVTEEVAPLMILYMRTIYICILPLVFAPILDNLFIAMGNTKLPMMLQGIAVSLNVVLNPLLIYGWGDYEGMGIAGAALATCISRALSCCLGFLLLGRLYRVRLFGGVPLRLKRTLLVVRQGLPMALTVGIYAGVYVGLFALVIGDLGQDVAAGFGIGFNAFESVSYPFILGIGMAGASLVGRNLGAGREAEAWQTVRHVRKLGRIIGLSFALIFIFGGPLIAPLFTDDPGVLKEVLSYVGVLAWSQLLLPDEVVNQNVLYGAGHPRAILWISMLGNVARLPLGWYLAVHLDFGAPGLWWTINATTLLKAILYHRQVQRGDWVRPISSAA